MSARWFSLVAGTCLACLIPAARAAAADTETRVFTVSVDGKPAGECRIVIRTGDDGTESVAFTASVQVRYLLASYHYSYRGTEVWTGGRLRQFDSASDDDGKKHTVKATADGEKLRVSVDGGAPRVSRSDLWPTNYWRMPAGAKPGQAIALLDVDTGEEQAAKIAAVVQQNMAVKNVTVPCTRISVAASVPAELWYDARGRMVVQETVEDGHKTVLMLREIQR
jgi:hypothetical protein